MFSLDVIEEIKFFGGISGIAALVWKLYETLGSYLQLDLTVDHNGVVTALASITNKGVAAKTLDYALLLIGPESEDPVVTAQEITRALSATGKPAILEEGSWTRESSV